jgi:hypothetical protein
MSGILGIALTAFVVVVGLLILTVAVGSASSSAGPVAAGVMMLFTVGALLELR